MSSKRDFISHGTQLSMLYISVWHGVGRKIYCQFVSPVEKCIEQVEQRDIAPCNIVKHLILSFRSSYVYQQTILFHQDET